MVEVQTIYPITGTPDNLNNSSLTQGSGINVGGASGTHTVTAVSMIKVSGAPTITGGGENANYIFTAPTKAEWLAQTGLVVTGDNTMIMMYDDPNMVPQINPDVNPDNGNLLDEIATAANGTFLYEFGFTGAAGEFWKARSTDSIDFFGGGAASYFPRSDQSAVY